MTRWVHSDAQVADALTKNVANSALVQLLMKGAWTLVEDKNFVSSKKRRLMERETRDMPVSSASVFGACETSMLLTCDLPSLPHVT